MHNDDARRASVSQARNPTADGGHNDDIGHSLEQQFAATKLRACSDALCQQHEAGLALIIVARSFH